jgi:hypothetical protein
MPSRRQKSVRNSPKRKHREHRSNKTRQLQYRHFRDARLMKDGVYKRQKYDENNIEE